MGDDDAMLDIVTSANVACGFHAGDPDIMAATFASGQAERAWRSAPTPALPIAPVSVVAP